MHTNSMKSASMLRGLLKKIALGEITRPPWVFIMFVLAEFSEIGHSQSWEYDQTMRNSKESGCVVPDSLEPLREKCSQHSEHSYRDSPGLVWWSGVTRNACLVPGIEQWKRLRCVCGGDMHRWLKWVDLQSRKKKLKSAPNLCMW